MKDSIYAFSVGDIKCVSISDGIQPIDANLLPTFFSGAATDDLLVAVRKYGISTDRCTLKKNKVIFRKI